MLDAVRGDVVSDLDVAVDAAIGQPERRVAGREMPLLTTNDRDLFGRHRFAAQHACHRCP